jgi:Protein of unknown function (DUF1761)
MSGPINHLAVIVAAIVYFIFGAIWFTVFGSSWAALSGRTGSTASATTFIVSFLLGVALAYVIGIALADSSNPNMVRHGIEFGVFMGVGIWATQLLNIDLYEARPIALWAIDAFYVVIGMAIMGAIIGGWRRRAA